MNWKGNPQEPQNGGLIKEMPLKQESQIERDSRSINDAAHLKHFWGRMEFNKKQRDFWMASLVEIWGNRSTLIFNLKDMVNPMPQLAEEKE